MGLGMGTELRPGGRQQRRHGVQIGLEGIEVEQEGGSVHLLLAHAGFGGRRLQHGGHPLRNRVQTRRRRSLGQSEDAGEEQRAPEPRRIPLSEARATFTPALLSFLEESRRMDNRRVREELGVALRHPDLASGLPSCLPPAAIG